MAKNYSTNEFDDSSYEDYHRELKKLRAEENKIRHEREKILSTRPWYSRTQNIIAVLAIFIPILASILFKVFDEDVKQLDVTYSQPQKLLASNEKIATNISIQYDSLNIDNISTLNVKFINSGDIPIKKSDFIDGAVEFQLKDKLGNNRKTVFILDILKIDDANQRNSVVELIRTDNNTGIFTYLPSLLNPGDIATLTVFISNEPFLEIEVNGKIENGVVNVNLAESFEQGNVNVNGTSQKLIQFFDNKVISIPFTLLVFFIFLVFNAVFWAKYNHHELNSEPKFVTPLLLILFTLISLFTLTFYIALLV